MKIKMFVWLARDFNGSLWLFVDDKPCKEGFVWITEGDKYYELNRELFSDICWTDSEPAKVAINILLDDMKVKDFKTALDTVLPDAEIKVENGEIVIPCAESDLTLYKPQDITDKIKTFEDAYDWCFHNEHYYLCHQYTSCNDFLDSDDYISSRAYLQLQIITCALNEGSKPTYDEGMWFNVYDIMHHFFDTTYIGLNMLAPKCLLFKTKELAKYAAKQFNSLYYDFYGIGKQNN